MTPRTGSVLCLASGKSVSHGWLLTRALSHSFEDDVLSFHLLTAFLYFVMFTYTYLNIIRRYFLFSKLCHAFVNDWPIFIHVSYRSIYLGFFITLINYFCFQVELNAVWILLSPMCVIHHSRAQQLLCTTKGMVFYTFRFCELISWHILTRSWLPTVIGEAQLKGTVTETALIHFQIENLASLRGDSAESDLTLSQAALMHMRQRWVRFNAVAGSSDAYETALSQTQNFKMLLSPFKRLHLKNFIEAICTVQALLKSTKIVGLSKSSFWLSAVPASAKARTFSNTFANTNKNWNRPSFKIRVLSVLDLQLDQNISRCCISKSKSSLSSGKCTIVQKYTKLLCICGLK